MPDTVGTHRPARLQAVAASPAQRVLVVANETATSPTLIAELRDRAARGPVSFHLVVPALNTRLRHWLSDTDDAVSDARRRGQDAAVVLGSHGLPVSVEIGDSVPLLAIEDALSGFDAQEIVISTRAPERSHWLEHDLVDRARGRFGVPVRRVIATDEVLVAA